MPVVDGPAGRPAGGPPLSNRPEGNNFNVLRLLFAVLVLVSHSYEIVDGNRSREPLTRCFHSLSLGELSVDGFFLLSGFLIVQSWRSRPVLKDFLTARVLRIYPGFIVAALLCAFVAGPLGSGVADYFGPFKVAEFAASVVTLRGPAIPPVFTGSHYPFVNNSLWTIKFEMACYLVVAIAGVLALANRPRFWLLAAVVSVAGMTALSVWPVLAPGGGRAAIPGPLADAVRLFSFFAVGAVYQVHATRIAFTRPRIAVAWLLLIALMFVQALAEPALAVFGSYVLFAVAFAPSQLLQGLRPPVDISYGIYLYAWPVQKLLVHVFPAIDALAVLLGALIVSVALGWLSWQCVESPAINLKRRLLRK